ncbi:MAG: hypothetical protein ACOC7U_06435 [Spirochaetota bacterium]
MKSKLLIPVVAVLLLAAPAVSLFAQDYNMSSVESDMENIVAGLSDFFGTNLGGMSYICDPVGNAFIKNFTIGAAGGAVLVPVEDLSFPEGTAMDIDFGDMGYIPVPGVGAYAKFSLKKLEFGAKLAGFPTYETDDGTIKVQNMIIGGKVRYKLTGFNFLLMKGGISVGALYEYMNGGLEIYQSDGFPVYADEIDSTWPHEVAATVTTDATINNTWSAHTLGGEAQANFQVLFLNFFVGSRLSKTLGSATSDFEGETTLTAEPDYEPYITEETQIIGPYSSETEPPGVDIYGFGGVEFRLFIFTIGARGSYNFTDQALAVDGGVRLQF